MAFWTLQQLQNTVGRDAVLAVLDDNDDGTADAEMVSQLQEECDTYVIDMIRGTRADDVMAGLIATPTPSVRRLSLRWAIAQIWQRSPQHARGDWVELEKAARAEMVDVRKSDMRIDVTPGEVPPANVGGVILAPSGDLLVSDVYCGGPFTFGNMGDF